MVRPPVHHNWGACLRIIWHNSAHSIGESPVLLQLVHSARASALQRHAITAGAAWCNAALSDLAACMKLKVSQIQNVPLYQLNPAS